MAAAAAAAVGSTAGAHMARAFRVTRSGSIPVLRRVAGDVLGHPGTSAAAAAAATAATAAATPAASGFKMPPEWVQHAGCWMLWPYRRDNWRCDEHAAGGAAAGAGALATLPGQKAYAAVARAIAQEGGEHVTVCVPEACVDHAVSVLAAECAGVPNIRVLSMESDDAWIRDSGPTFLLSADGNQLAGVDWVFNAYGGKYANWQRDDAIAAQVLEAEGAKRFRAPLVMEGGSFHVDGEGTALVTEETLLRKGRNPDLTKEQIETYLCQYLGVEKVLWLTRGVVGDEDTNGHIDNMACFVRPGEVLLHWTDDKSDPQYARSHQAYELLCQFKDARGRSLVVHKCPMPSLQFYTEADLSGLVLTETVADGSTEFYGEAPRTVGDRLAASYINYYVANKAIIMPAFGVPEDAAAAAVLASLYPGRKVVPVMSRDILLGGGNIHCITQQQPAVGTAPRVVTIAATQMACSTDHPKNVDGAETMVRLAARSGANVILIQELFETPYFCQDELASNFDFARTLEDNPVIARFQRLAVELGVVLPVSFFERAGYAHYNSVAMIDATGELLGVYRKSHIPDGPGYEEKFYFSPGDTGFKVFSTAFGTIGVGICWDQWFPECARAMALMGAEIILYPTAIGSEPQDPTLNSRGHWRRAMIGHSAANMVPVVASNRVGVERGVASSITFYGNSFITDGTGDLLTTADHPEEAVLLATVDLGQLAAARRSFGLFRDRRCDLYPPLLTLDGKTKRPTF